MFAAFANAIPLTNSEVNLVLDAVIRDRREKEALYQPTPQMKKTKEYSDKFSAVKNGDVIEKIVEYVPPPRFGSV